MEQIIISFLNKLGLGINGVINQSFEHGAESFASSLNEMTDNKFEFAVAEKSADKIVYSTNVGVQFVYTINERGAIKSVEVELRGMKLSN